MHPFAGKFEMIQWGWCIVKHRLLDIIQLIHILQVYKLQIMYFFVRLYVHAKWNKNKTDEWQLENDLEYLRSQNPIKCDGVPSWRHQMETFSALLAIYAGNSPVPGDFPAQRPVTRSFDVFFDLRLNNQLSEQSWGWRFKTLSCPLLRHSNAVLSWGRRMGSKAFATSSKVLQVQSAQLIQISLHWQSSLIMIYNNCPLSELVYL